jgi:uncharacterized protein YdiU (UPF0061 family)
MIARGDTPSLLTKIMIVNFDNSYKKLPERFYQSIEPSPVANPKLIKFNYSLADELNIISAGKTEKNIADYFSGNQILNGSEPLAQAYAGHQFGHFVPQLGDGRAILLGEVLDRNSSRKDIQLKGSGPTNFSRRGDGRAWLGPVLREYLLSETMHNLGIPTTRALCAVSTGENIYRTEPLPGAILTRIASSHIRVGTFEYFSYRSDREALEILINHVIDRHFQDLNHSSNKALELLKRVASAQSQLIVKWLSVGFVHGVMNTDNTSIAGETIDYGPCAFMDTYDPGIVFSSIDHYGRYSYKNQSEIGLWNISCLAGCLLDFIDTNRDRAISACQEVFDEYKKTFKENHQKIFLQKIGIFESSNQQDEWQIVQEFLDFLKKYRGDFTLSFRNLSSLVADDNCNQFLAGFDDGAERNAEFTTWLKKWRAKIQSQSSIDLEGRMNTINPAFIPRNHNVEEMIKLAQQGDYGYFEDLLACLQNPYNAQARFQKFYEAPSDKSAQYVTFCGT